MKKRVKLYRAQEGMQVQDPQQLQQALIAQIQSDMQQGVAKEQTVMSIYNTYSEMFNNPIEVKQFVDSVYETVLQQQDDVQAQMQGQADADAASAFQDQIASQSELEEADEMAMAQMGMQVGNPSYFTGIDAFVPPNYVDMMSNPAFAYGGQKSKYVKDKLALVKKQMGGQDETQSTGVDQIGEDQRKKSLQGFINTVKNTSAMANAKKQAEQEYDQMMAQMGGEERDFTAYTHGEDDIFHDQMNYLVEAQYGGMTSKQQRQLQKSMSRIPFGAIPTTPVEKIDVRKTGMFGRPKEYSIEFASPLQAIGAPGAAAAYGYGITQATARKTEGKKGTVQIATTPAQNKQEVAKAEEQSGATTSTGSTTGGGGTGSTGGGNTGGGEDNTIVETPTPKQGSYFQYIPGRPYAYVEGSNGNWLYKGENGNKWQTVTNEDALAILNTGQSKSGQLVTLPGKEGYYYRRRNDGSYVKFKGDPSKHYEGKAPIKSGDKPMIIKPGDKNFDYLEENAKWMLKPYIPKVATKEGQGRAVKDLTSRMYPNTPIPKLTKEDKINNVLDPTKFGSSEEWDVYEQLPWYEKMFADRPGTVNDVTMPGYAQLGEDYGLMPTHFITTLPGAAMNLIEGTGTNPNLLNAGQRMLNPGQGMLNQGQGMLNAGQKMLNPGQPLLNPPAGTQFRLFAVGGNVMNPQSDMFGKLQEFVYGGGDDPSVPYINQADVNYTNSKDTSDAYFQDGGEEQFDFTVSNTDKAINQVNPLYQSDARTLDVLKGMDQAQQKQQQFNPYSQFGYNPMMGYPGAAMFNNGSMAPWYAGSWNQVQRGPYTKSGQTFNPAGYGTTGAISKIDVTKSNWRGAPKKYSITYSNPNQLAPRGTGTTSATGTAKSPQESMTKEPKFSNTEGLGFGAASAIRRGERQNARQLARGEKEFGTAEQQAQAYERANPMQRIATRPQLSSISPRPLQSQTLTPRPAAQPKSSFDQKGFIEKEYGDIYPEIKDYYDMNAVDATPEAASERVEAALARRNEALGFIDPSRLTNENFVKGMGDPNGSYININKGWDVDYMRGMEGPMSKAQKAANEAGMQRNPMMLAYGGNIQYQTGNEVVTPIDQDERFEPLPTKSAQTVGNELMMQSRKNIQDQANFLPEEYTVDYKVKNAFNVNYPMAMNAANAIGNIGASFLENRGNEYQGALTQEELTGTDARKFAGNFSEYGEFRPDRQGNKSNSAFSKYGGATEGDELYMTEEEIERFLAEGGELEYL